jgi:hypothetical protein
VPVPPREIRAAFDAETITVYQAYSPAIALPALDAQRFVPPFKRDRMTWVKPSFLWMMYRCGWATKEGQEHVLAVRLHRAGFDAAVAGACLSHYSPDVHPSQADWSRQLRTSPVRVQWDPERSLHLQPLEHRSLQLGLSGDAVHRYVDDWTVDIHDVTPLAHAIHALVRNGALDEARALLPPERPYQPATAA